MEIDGSMASKDYYKILGIDKDASQQEIKRAYRDLAITYHPDRNPSDPSALAKIQEINEAYAVLSNLQKKRDYDALRAQYGPSAHDRFRSSYTAQDIFQGSDIREVFEEIAQSLGIRGLDDILKQFEGQGFHRFEAKRPGFYVKGLVFAGWLDGSKSLLGLAQNLLKLLGGGVASTKQLPLNGEDIHDAIQLRPEHAQQGGPYAYYHKKRGKKLVVKIPPRTRNGQQVRLPGMGEKGQPGGMPGDLFLKVQIKGSLLQRVKGYLDSLL